MENKMTFEEFAANYEPSKNHIDTNAPYNGYMFETFDKEFEHVLNQHEKNVWTLIESDSGECIVAGKHWVNRIGYFITEKPHTNNISFSLIA